MIKQFLANQSNTTRVHKTTGVTQGAGGSVLLYVGSSGSYDYDAWLRFVHDWSDVGKIIKCELVFVTGNPAATLVSNGSAPKASVRRLTGDWDEGTMSAGAWVTEDYIAPPYVTSDWIVINPSKTIGAVNRVDITAIAEAWAPTTVQKRDGKPGANNTNYGILLAGYGDTSHRFGFEGEDHATPSVRPYLELTYDIAVTAPAVPTNLAPVGAVASIGSFQGDFADTDSSDTLYSTQIEVYDATPASGTPLWTTTKLASNTEIINERFNVVPDDLVLARNTTYYWRARVRDQEAMWSAWTADTAFSVTNTDPDAPTLTPAAQTYSTLNGVLFRGGTFSDPDGDSLLAYQAQLSTYPQGNPNWDDADFILWDTGKRYVASGSTDWQTAYSGQALAAGTYYWRARVWDQHDGVSVWAYTSIILDTDFNPDPGTQSTQQIDPHAPWRVVIREMEYLPIGGALTGDAGTDVITSATPHGMAENRRIRFSGLTGGNGLVDGVDYYVIASSLTATTFKVSTALGGSPVDFTSNITAGSITAITTRGPGTVLAIFEHAKSVGGSIMYNAAGTMHFTLVVDDPQIAVVEPKQTHYSVQFYGGDGWRETFAGLVDNFDATETSVVFTGIDYLGLLDYTMDERYFPADPNRAHDKGGSYYSNQTLSTVVIDQLTKVSQVADSPVGFITIGAIATMDEKVSIYSTMQPVLGFVGSLLDSHRQGTGKRTRIKVARTTGGGYEFVVEDDPGQNRDNLRLRYGELIQSYRVIPFGPTWASVLNAIGRTREGVKVLYKTKIAPGLDPKVWGRFARAIVLDNVSDAIDLDRRAAQAAIHGGKLGQQVGFSIRTGMLAPLDGYDICDAFPVSIAHGAVYTANWGSGYWVCYGLTWEAGDDQNQEVVLTLLPVDDEVSPAGSLIDAQPISPQEEWNIGWTPPDPDVVFSRYWLDQNRGIVYQRRDLAAPQDLTGGTATTGLITVSAPHGFIAGDRIYFGNLNSETGVVEGQTYYVLASNLTSTDFEFSETSGGATYTFDQDITTGVVNAAPVYEALDPGDVMEPPTTVPSASAPTVASALVSGIVRLRVTLNDTAEAKVRQWEVQITSKYSGATPDWTTPQVHPLPQNATELSAPALGGTSYTVRVRAVDVFGNFGAFSSEVQHTTIAGSDALAAAIAAIADDVTDGVITETKIADGAISTPKLQAGAVTAEVLAATLVLASLIKTADTGRRIEIDVDGIRLYDTDESLLVRIPTNGDPVYVKGQVDADSLISQTSATFRTAVSVEGNTTLTVQNGVSAPSNVPSLAASVDSLALTSTPQDIAAAAGIAYDSGAGSVWIAADPTQAGGYVAHEFSLSTGALIRSIEATGTLEEYTATLGATSHISDSADGIVGTTDSHISTPLSIPGGLSNVKVTKVAVWMTGRLGTCSTRNGIWNTSNVSLGESATYVASDGGSTGVGKSVLQNKTLSSPVSVSAGQTVRIGFRRMNSSDGSQHDKDDGSGKTEYSGDGFTADGTGWGTRDSAGKPNAYLTYTHEVDSRLETAPNIGVATDGTHVYTLDSTGVIWKYLRSDGSYVANSAVLGDITGTKSKAGLFYDATAAKLVVTTTTGTGGAVYAKFVQVDPSTLTAGTTYSGTGSDPTSYDGTTDTFRGGARLNDPLNGNAATYWVATTSAVYAYTFSGSTATQTSNRHFGQASTVGQGLTHDGTQFRGFASATPTKVWKFSAWDWTTANATYWVGYAWYDSVATTHETALGPRGNITMRRRERLQVTTPAIPTGGGDDPDKVRIYMLPGASDFSAGSGWLQVTDALTSRYLTDYTGSGTNDGSGTAFPSGTPAELRSALAVASGGWSLKGDGTFQFRQGTAFPASPATNDRWFRTDHQLEYFYNGTRWLSTQLFRGEFGPSRSNSISAITTTTADATIWPVPVTPGSDIWLEDYVTQFYVGAGTALGASHKWVGDMHKRNSAAGNTTVATVNIDSGASTTFRTITVAIDALLGSGYYVMQTTWTKTGAPGELTYYPAYITYRIVAT